MQETLSFSDLTSLIVKKRDFPSRFSARKLWMLVHKEFPNVGIDEFSKKLQMYSRDKKELYSDDQKDASMENEIIFEYKVNQNGIRKYKIISNDNAVIKSKDIISKIKYVMCNLNQPTLHITILKIDDLGFHEKNEIKENTQTAGNNILMTEIEISEKIGIKKERIRPFIRILIELGIIVTEKIENRDFLHAINQINAGDSNELNTINSKQINPIVDDNFSPLKSINEQNNTNNNDFILDINDLAYLHVISDDGSKTNYSNDVEKSSINAADNNIENEGEMGYFTESTKKNCNGLKEDNDRQINNSKDSSARRLKWDENQEMRLKNLSSSFEYLNKLRTMKNSLVALISKEKDQI